ncbi:MAG TPA: hypothetical protein VHU18_03455 [Rhizomicrobium sp.]|jgi:hypothetical protein|nr:hypothetical protein [Rhizomicrobium sp.]
MKFTIGHTRRGNPVDLSEEERSRHLHILGASGTGKSKLIECMIRQDILAGRGLCLIDPHGTLAESVAAFCASRGLSDFRAIHVVEPANTEWTFGFNPLRLDGTTEPATRVDAMVAACAQVWGGERLDATPLLKKCLRSVFYVLAVRGLTLVEAVDLINSADPRALRRKLTHELPDYVFDGLWQEFNALPKRDFAEQFSSTNNRLIEFLSAPILRRIVGQNQRAIDLKRVMDNHEILIVNLAPRGALSADNARLLGTLLTSELFLLALARDEAIAHKAPFYLYIDECYDYLTNDVERMLDQTRKFGLHLCLSHQRLGQLRDRSEAIYNGVMTGGQTKIVFGGLEDDDAEVMARQIMRSSFNLERPKRSLNKPIVIDEVPYWLESVSYTESSSSSSGSSQMSGRSSGTGASESYNVDNEMVGSGASISSGESGAYGTNSSTTSGRSTTRGFSQTLKPVRVMMPTAVHSLEEEIHQAILKLRELPRQAAVVKRRGRQPVRIRAPEVNRVLVSAEQVRTFKNRCCANSPFISFAAAIDAEIEGRRKFLEAAETETPRASSFWHEERTSQP